MPLLNVDWRVLLVDATGAALGSASNPITTTAGASSTQNVQGVQAAGAAITENPVLVAGQFSGNVKILGLDTNGGVTQGQPNAGGTASWPVQGAAASGAAATGNPVLVGGSDGTNAQAWLSGTGSGAGMQRVATGINTAAADATANAAGFTFIDNAGIGRIPTFWPMSFNGVTWDRQRNNIDVTLLASASRTTTQTSADITTFNLGAISVFLNMTVVGTGSVTLTINGKDPASGVYYNILTGAAVVTNVGNLYRVMPGIPAVANKDVNAYLPRIIQLVVTANNANPATYSVGYTLHTP